MTNDKWSTNEKDWEYFSWDREDTSSYKITNKDKEEIKNGINYTNYIDKGAKKIEELVKTLEYGYEDDEYWNEYDSLYEKASQLLPENSGIYAIGGGGNGERQFQYYNNETGTDFVVILEPDGHVTIELSDEDDW